MSSLDEILKANPNAPTNDQFAVDFAKKLFPPKDQHLDEDLNLSLFEGPLTLRASDEPAADWCGEATVGLLEATMASNLLSDSARREIEDLMTDSMPALEREKTIGHFHFQWTEDSPDDRDNVTEADIDATAVFLNDHWDKYSNDFRQPKASLIGGQRMIDIEVYYQASLHGSTSSQTNKIFLNSFTVVRDPCRRCTTTGHELFHRVQYAYGYTTGTAGQRWWIEGLAAWSQNYICGGINDYVSRVNGGLTTPDKTLLQRAYDACHYWQYLGEQVRKRSASIPSDERAIREFVREYANNGLNAKAASDTVTQTHLTRSFNRFFQDWSKANYIKDLDNPGLKYEYDEDEEVTNVCGRVYGPYAHVLPVEDRTITDDAFSWTSPTRFLTNYGTHYHLLHIDPAVTKFSVRFEGNPSGGDGTFSAHLIMIKDNRWVRIFNGGSPTQESWSIDVAPGEYDRCVAVVNALETGGQYEISINACLSGIWQDNYNYIWTLAQSGQHISGTVQTTTCGVYNVTGEILGEAITLNAAGSCCGFQYQGAINDCLNGAGEWTNDCGGAGSWTLNRSAADAARERLDLEDEELADDPATMRG